MSQVTKSIEINENLEVEFNATANYDNGDFDHEFGTSNCGSSVEIVDVDWNKCYYSSEQNDEILKYFSENQDFIISELEDKFWSNDVY